MCGIPKITLEGTLEGLDEISRNAAAYRSEIDENFWDRIVKIIKNLVLAAVLLSLDD
ncbi:16291_t:CDS:2 [Gigaspora margarita]|uniref:16291_t:CDS:1 n=1 Tax=Gigaspora margarita TaxID=4874 RepID=A0ABM8VVZ5_GIGMA|nr:16291_t:CDS:2 [Gigaspora margarita]